MIITADGFGFLVELIDYFHRSPICFEGLGHSETIDSVRDNACSLLYRIIFCSLLLFLPFGENKGPVII